MRSSAFWSDSFFAKYTKRVLFVFICFKYNSKSSRWNFTFLNKYKQRNKGMVSMKLYRE